MVLHFPTIIVSKLDPSCFVVGNGNGQKAPEMSVMSRMDCLNQVRLKYPLANAAEIEPPNNPGDAFKCWAIFGTNKILASGVSETCIFNGRFL